MFIKLIMVKVIYKKRVNGIYVEVLKTDNVKGYDLKLTSDFKNPKPFKSQKIILEKTIRMFIQQTGINPNTVIKEGFFLGYKEITREYLNQNKTENGGYTKPQIEALGLIWPPKLNWKGLLLGGYISPENAEIFESKKTTEQDRRLRSLKIVGSD